MLGHKVAQTLAQDPQKRFRVAGTVRGSAEPYRRPALEAVFAGVELLGGVSAEDFDSVVAAIEGARPQAVVNAVGVIKQDPTAQDPVTTIQVNALFPHQLARLTAGTGARLIHVSTDCVFSGRKGSYEETDAPDAEDLYGRSKLLGEVASAGALTLRTSLIGRELAGSRSLIEWFLGQRGGRVKGFTQAIFSGFTTLAFSHLVARILLHHRDLSGLWQVSAPAIDKHSLLLRLREAYDVAVEIEPAELPELDRSLVSRRFQEATGEELPGWDEMMQGLADDPTPYDEIRGSGDQTTPREGGLRDR
jgi:dTDP-4-dehydrorhamnose reductase